MSKIILYSHGGSGNHGCEAIVRGTYNVLKGQIDELYSYRKDEDIKYGLDKLLTVCNHTCKYPRFSLKRIKASILIRLFHDNEYSEKITYDALLNNVNKGDIALSIGGDNYCYDSFDEYSLCNKYLTKKKVKTVLWGCSVDPSKINTKMVNDLKLYNLIIARESITYEALKKINNNTYLAPDPAFLLELSKVDLPRNFEKNNIIGINVSPMIIDNEKIKGITRKNYINLINYILQNTDFQIALIPHVVWTNNDDRNPIKDLYEYFNKNKRIIVIDDYNCKELKYIISKCKVFIGARTHATIAAYSTCVPTLVVGYSVKARGIAKDIFGTYENYVVPVQSLRNENDLLNSFQWLMKNEIQIKNHLSEFMPGYKQKVSDMRNKLNELKTMENYHE